MGKNKEKFEKLIKKACELYSEVEYKEYIKMEKKKNRKREK